MYLFIIISTRCEIYYFESALDLVCLGRFRLELLKKPFYLYVVLISKGARADKWHTESLFFCCSKFTIATIISYRGIQLGHNEV